MSATAPTLIAERISHSYGNQQVLHEVSLRVEHGQVLGLIGPNGSGKTTLLRTLYGAVTPGSGRVWFHGRELSGFKPRELAQQLGVVVQEPPSDLMLSVADTVLLGRTPHLGLWQRSSSEDDALAQRALEQVGLLHLANREFATLSGGEKQRVLIARALAQQAQCLLLDEPTNHLDISYQHQVLQLVRELGLTAVVVLHDLNLAARYFHEILMLSHGKVSAQGTPAEVFTRAQVEPVYGIDAEPVRAADGTPQLLFRTAASSQVGGNNNHSTQEAHTA